MRYYARTTPTGVNTMTFDNRAALTEAADCLADDVDARQLYAQMSGIIELLERGIPAQLTGRPAILNPLVSLYSQDPQKFDRVIDLINRTRKERDLPTLANGADTDDRDRRAYMREFMAQKREKQAMLMRLWNLLRSEHDKIKGVRRMEFEREHAARWQDEKKRREEAARIRLGRRLSETERKVIATKLWEDVQGELDALEVFVNEEMRKPLHLRSRDGFQFKVGVFKKDGK